MTDNEQKHRVGTFVAVCEGTATGLDKEQICRTMKDYSASKGVENGQKDKQVKARGAGPQWGPSSADRTDR